MPRTGPLLGRVDGDAGRDDRAVRPETLKPVEHTFLLVEDMDDEIAEVDEDPARFVLALTPQSLDALLEHGLLHGIRDGGDSRKQLLAARARAEGILPASESNHAIAGAIAHLRAAEDDGEGQVVLIGVSGSGQLDLPAYADYLSGEMLDA